MALSFAIFGRIWWLRFECHDQQVRVHHNQIVNPLRIKQNHRAELESSLVLFYTGVSRESANIIDEQVQNVISGNANSLQAMHDLKSIW